MSRGFISCFHQLLSINTKTSPSSSSCLYSFCGTYTTDGSQLLQQPPQSRIIEAKPDVMTPSWRTGLVAIKCGMSALLDKWGARVPITMLWVDDNVVTQIKTVEKEGFFPLQVCCGQKKEKYLTKPEVGHFRAQGVPLKRKLREFPVTEDALLPVCIELGIRHFIPEQFVNVAGITRGKGFQVR